MDGKYQQAMGIAIECRRLDKLEEAITKSDNVHGTLSYCINVSHSFVNLREYRHEVNMTLFPDLYTVQFSLMSIAYDILVVMIFAHCSSATCFETFAASKEIDVI